MSRQRIPHAWVSVRLGDVALINPPVGRPDVPDEAPVSFVPMASVEEETGRLDATNTRRFGDLRRKGYRYFEEGDVIFAKITPCMENGKVALAKGLQGRCAFGSTEFHVLRPLEGIDSRYILHYVLQKSFRDEARRYMTGTAGQLRVPAKFLESAEIPLAPTAEQRLIVAAIEEQFSRIDAGVDALQRARRNVQRMRGAVLQAAVTGRLVPQDPEDESAEILLKRLLDQQRRGATGRRQEGARLNSLPEPPSAEPLPHGWTWARLDQVAITSSGGTPRRDRSEYFGGSIPWVKSGELPDGPVRRTAEYLTEQGLANSSAHVVPRGTLMIALYGVTVGKLGILDMDHAATNQAVCTIQPVIPEMRDYVWWVLRHRRTDLISQGRGGAQPNISQEILRKLVFALPPLPEQRRIAEQVERYWSVLGAAAGAIVANTHRSERLRRAVLSSAFRGSLVPQDPLDEPAFALLDRIKAAHAPNNSVSGRQRTRSGR